MPFLATFRSYPRGVSATRRLPRRLHTIRHGSRTPNLPSADYPLSRGAAALAHFPASLPPAPRRLSRGRPAGPPPPPPPPPRPRRPPPPPPPPPPACCAL